eukprot:gnl/TRDRNA2_/TRDRNA2_148541_c1_seq1.p1 gnl/TRDRNA2_/TRDRNA2_148541_c1~~gnl/TRDRNA2_/TRDRNA2_148541_c1_seq1.p1  ORF type:complete len:332 (-),score=52.00 gnl/TRDRNA2_/TRDRNA2_148541_c1_seq1:68-931(-)
MLHIDDGELKCLYQGLTDSDGHDSDSQDARQEKDQGPDEGTITSCNVRGSDGSDSGCQARDLDHALEHEMADADQDADHDIERLRQELEAAKQEAATAKKEAAAAKQHVDRAQQKLLRRQQLLSLTKLFFLACLVLTIASLLMPANASLVVCLPSFLSVYGFSFVWLLIVALGYLMPQTMWSHFSSMLYMTPRVMSSAAWKLIVFMLWMFGPTWTLLITMVLVMMLGLFVRSVTKKLLARAELFVLVAVQIAMLQWLDRAAELDDTSFGLVQPALEQATLLAKTIGL